MKNPRMKSGDSIIIDPITNEYNKKKSLYERVVMFVMAEFENYFEDVQTDSIYYVKGRVKDLLSIYEIGRHKNSLQSIWCLLRQLLLLSRNPHKLLYSDPSSQKHEKPPKNYLQCREDFPKAELFFDQPSLHCRCPYFLPEF